MSAPTFLRGFFKKRIGKFFLGLLGIVVLFGFWVGIDLSRPHQTDIREFDPNEVARLDTAMWRSYYARQRLLMFRQLAELLRRQYHFTYWKSNAVAFQAAKAAFVFKDGHNRAEYERALPELRIFYHDIRAVSTSQFDADEVAKRELEWWIVHRERAKHKPGDLQQALADTAAAIYNLPASRFAEHARLRAEAMHIRDTKAVQGGVTEADWKQIDDLLHQSWQSLWQAVH